MSNVEGMTKCKTWIARRLFRRSGFVIDSSLVIRHSSFRSEASFTVIELLLVIAIIIILAGLILSTAGYVQKKGARSRAEAEIAAMSAALESYKADNGIYPRQTATTDAVDARAATDFVKYQAASQYLYGQLAADADFDGVPDAGSRSYMQFKPNQLGKDATGKPYLRDPFGNSYGYSTVYQSDSTKGYNPTFDLWSTAGLTSGNDQTQWIKNW
jgi:type II secretory pathway pseudopilin PulG